MSDWLDLMLEEIARKKREQAEADEEAKRRAEAERNDRSRNEVQSR